MSKPIKGLVGLFDPRLRTKDYPPSDPTLEGHFAGAAMSVVRDESTVLFGAGTGERNIEIWRTPSAGCFIIEGGTLELRGNPTQSGTPDDLLVVLEVERAPSRFFPLARGMLRAEQWSGGVYSTSLAPSVFGLAGESQFGATDVSGGAYVESPLLAWDGRLMVTTGGADFLAVMGYSLTHGLAIDDRVSVEPGPGGSLPVELARETAYYVVGPTSPNLFYLSATLGGASIALSAATDPIFAIVHEAGVRMGSRGIYVGDGATRFRGAKVRVRCLPSNGANSYTLSAMAALQIRMVR